MRVKELGDLAGAMDRCRLRRPHPQSSAPCAFSLPFPSSAKIPSEIPTCPKRLGPREHLIAALEADLIGRYEGAEAFATSTERLRIPPSRWYLTGFLAAMEARGVVDPPDDDAGGDSRQADKRFLFQVGLDIEHPHGFVPRPNARGETSSDPDEQIADLQFRHCAEWAVGHGVSARPLDDAEGGPVRQVGTIWLPRAEVRRVVAHEVPGLATDMETLAELAAAVDPAPLAAALGPLPAAYEPWIVKQEAIPLDSVARRATRDRLLRDVRTAKDRIAAGIALLTSEAGADVARGVPLRQPRNGVPSPAEG